MAFTPQSSPATTRYFYNEYYQILILIGEASLACRKHELIIVIIIVVVFTWRKRGSDFRATLYTFKMDIIVSLLTIIDYISVKTEI